MSSEQAFIPAAGISEENILFYATNGYLVAPNKKFVVQHGYAVLLPALGK
ncbi:hypothetical protein HGH93_14225 [Chitinophaga polysaccharea]|nr:MULTISPECIES: hypothetical protein [Chitinophaga]NLR59269.1 hypothetical protein [Chitinophaga polysaccharea]NLU91963.1 hypothetical protein [Chitinophaga sp. Ak27]